MEDEGDVAIPYITGHTFTLETPRYVEYAEIDVAIPYITGHTFTLKDGRNAIVDHKLLSQSRT